MSSNPYPPAPARVDPHDSTWNPQDHRYGTAHSHGTYRDVSSSEQETLDALDEPRLRDAAHGSKSGSSTWTHDPSRVGSAGVEHQRLASTPGRGPAAQTAGVMQACLDTAKEVLASDDHTNRALRLLRPMIWASVVVILGAAVITASTLTVLLVMGSGPWWESLATGLGIAAIGSLGTAVVHAYRRQAAQRLPAVVGRRPHQCRFLAQLFQTDPNTARAGYEPWRKSAPSRENASRDGRPCPPANPPPYPHAYEHPNPARLRLSIHDQRVNQIRGLRPSRATEPRQY